MAPHTFSTFNQNAIPQNAVIATLIGVWILLGVGFFFGQTKLYIALLLVSGFTGTLAWISLCLSQISFRSRLYQAGYTNPIFVCYTLFTLYRNTCHYFNDNGFVISSS